MKKTIYNPDTLGPPVGHFDRAVRFDDWLFISGTSALTHLQGDISDRHLVEGIEAQTHQTLDSPPDYIVLLHLHVVTPLIFGKFKMPRR